MEPDAPDRCFTGGVLFHRGSVTLPTGVSSVKPSFTNGGAMRRRPLESLGALVREKRSDATLRQVAGVIGIGPATLLRVESGRVPDVATFGRICAWLGVDPAVFLGSTQQVGSEPDKIFGPGAIQVSAHFRAEQAPQPETLQALAQMLLLASRIQPARLDSAADERS
jgi:transcriptional regulator with XRE-family HTH domain